MIKYMPLRKADFTTNAVFGCDNVKKYKAVLELAYKTVFKKTDYVNMSRKELVQLNKLLGYCFELIEHYCPDDLHNINSVTILGYLSRSLLHFGCVNHLSAELILKHRDKPSEIKMARMSSSWIPKTLKTYLRKFYAKAIPPVDDIRICPEILYSALAMYVCRELALDTGLNDKEYKILHVLRMFKREIGIRTHHQSTGLYRQKLTDFDELYKQFVEEYDKGRYFDCDSILQLKDGINKDFEVSMAKAAEFVKRLKAERGSAILPYHKNFIKKS